jgi:hypothetical protein
MGVGKMQIIFQGQQSGQEAVESFLSVISLFCERYGIKSFQDMKLKFEPVDAQGDEVELIDPMTSEVFSIFEVTCSKNHTRVIEMKSTQGSKITKGHLQLVVDNTNKKL